MCYKYNLFKVRYEDGDEEEITREELLEYLVTDEAGEPLQQGTQHEEREEPEERELDPSTSEPERKRRKRDGLDVSEVPMNLDPIPSDRPGTSSRFKGVAKSGEKWLATINIPSKGGHFNLGTFDSEEEAGIIFARARYKYPVDK